MTCDQMDDYEEATVTVTLVYAIVGNTVCIYTPNNAIYTDLVGFKQWERISLRTKPSLCEKIARFFRR